MRSGEYVTFVDSDDYIDNQYLEKMYNCTDNKNIDYIRCLIANRGNVQISEKTYTEKEEFQEIFDMLLNTYKLSSVWCGMVKREILENKKIRFKEEYNYAEDYLFNIEIFKNIKTFKYINYNGYYYRENEESLTNKFNKEKLINNLKMAIKAYKELYGLFPNDKVKVDNRIEKEVLHILDSIFYATTKTTQKQRMELYRKVSEILKKENDIFKSYDITLLNNKHYMLYDLKNNVLKKFPRKIKQVR